MTQNTNFIIIATYSMYVHALMTKVRLESEGIEVTMENENTVLANPLYSYALGGVVLKVKEEDRKKALEILKAKDAEEKDCCSSFCPQCDSEKIESVKKTILGFQSHPVSRCRECGHEWSPLRF
ncbi:MAG: hypothetical protein ACLFVQ_11095 [Chitinispirillaceae bacterium]